MSFQRKEQKKLFDRKINIAELLVVTIMIFIIGFSAGYFIKSGFNIFLPKEESTAEENEIIKVYNDLLLNAETKINSNLLKNSAINGMITSLGDNYAEFYNEEEKNEFYKKINGYYNGVGIEIIYDSSNIVVSKVFDNTPAKKAGINVNDLIISINGQSVKGNTLSEVSSLIKTSKSNEIVFMRENKEVIVNVIPSNVIIPSVTSKVIQKEKKIGYIDIDVFAQNSFKQFKENLEDLENKKIDSLIIDLRDNNGGYLSVAKDVLNLFMKKTEILYLVKNKQGIEKIMDNTDEYRKYQIVVLLNKNSASASEILASSLQETYGATVVGEKSYGKGSVQTTYSLSTGAMFKYTTEYWLTPKGQSINGMGINPNIEAVNISEKDLQLEKSLEILNK